MSRVEDLDRLRRAMEELSARTNAQIRAYPAPITACDEQFNHLLELRRQLPLELARLDAARAEDAIDMAEFIRTSPCKEALAALLRTGSPVT